MMFVGISPDGRLLLVMASKLLGLRQVCAKQFMTRLGPALVLSNAFLPFAPESMLQLMLWRKNTSLC